MNLAYRFPTIFWNCACLISDSGGNESADEDEDESPEEIIEYSYNNCIEEFVDDAEDEDEDDDEEEKVDVKKKKKKAKTTNYGKIASAIGKMRMAGISVSPPDINKSTFTFSPDVENSTIRYGMSGIVKVGEDIVKSIIANRPYTSIPDFLSKVKTNKPQMINLIKCGAFDAFGDRVSLMREYVGLISDTKKRITLQNMAMLINFGMLPEELDFERRVYNFTKYLKKMKLDASFYGLDNIALGFLDKNFSLDCLSASNETESGFKISITAWDKIYKKYMDNVRKWIKENHDDILNAVNERLTQDIWNKYCLGSISKWEMDSVSCYFHEHELQNIDEHAQGFSNFFKLKEQPDVETYFKPRGKDSDSAPIPIYRIHRICGTVLDRDKAKKIVSLLTKDGVVQVKIFGEAFANYDKQISERGLDGKKHVIEKSVFSRGNKIIVCGIRKDDSFILKTYARTPWHSIEIIEDVLPDGRVISRNRGDI